jgi:hypothetical protein
METLLQHEKKYALRHMVNVLHHMGLTYPQLFEPSDYKEDTNVLAYVVLTAILMHHDFLAHHMSMMPNFTLTPMLLDVPIATFYNLLLGIMNYYLKTKGAKY